jgi:hypothetical protein
LEKQMEISASVRWIFFNTLNSLAAGRVVESFWTDEAKIGVFPGLLVRRPDSATQKRNFNLWSTDKFGKFEKIALLWTVPSGLCTTGHKMSFSPRETTHCFTKMGNQETVFPRLAMFLHGEWTRKHCYVLEHCFLVCLEL